MTESQEIIVLDPAQSIREAIGSLGVRNVIEDLGLKTVIEAVGLEIDLGALEADTAHETLDIADFGEKFGQFAEDVGIVEQFLNAVEAPVDHFRFDERTCYPAFEETSPHGSHRPVDYAE